MVRFAFCRHPEPLAPAGEGPERELPLGLTHPLLRRGMGFGMTG